MMRRLGNVHAVRLMAASESTHVYEAVDARGERVVLKCSAEGEASARLRARLRGELEVLATFDADCIVRPREWVEDANGFGFTMQRTPDLSPLSWFVRRRGTDVGFALNVARGIARALACVHRAGFVHRDVKPSNVLTDERGERVVLIDFGLHAWIGERAMNGAVGTYAYMPPEQTGLVDCEVDERADYYSLGATLYEMLTGAPPFEGTEGEMMCAHVARAPAAPWVTRPALSEAVSAIALRLLSKAPANRYQTVLELCTDLAACARSHGELGAAA
jgi:serine/threonine protein kinase